MVKYISEFWSLCKRLFFKDDIIFNNIVIKRQNKMKIINIRLKLNLKTKKKKEGRFCIVERIETLKNKDFKVILTYDPVLCGIVGSFTSIISIHSF